MEGRGNGVTELRAPVDAEKEASVKQSQGDIMSEARGQGRT